MVQEPTNADEYAEAFSHALDAIGMSDDEKRDALQTVGDYVWNHSDDFVLQDEVQPGKPWQVNFDVSTNYLAEGPAARLSLEVRARSEERAQTIADTLATLPIVELVSHPFRLGGELPGDRDMALKDTAAANQNPRDFNDRYELRVSSE